MDLIGAGIETSKEKQPTPSSGNASPPTSMTAFLIHAERSDDYSVLLACNLLVG